MKRKILLSLFILSFGFILVACNKNNIKHNIEVEEVETIVKWSEIEYHFKVKGEDEQSKIADGSLSVTVYKEKEVIIARQPTPDSEGVYKAIFNKLELDTEYKIVVTASINQKKETLIEFKVVTLLDGGDKDNPIVINTVEDWKNMDNVYAFYKLGQDIDFNGEEIPEVFTRTGVRGGFDGDNHSLKNFKVNYKEFYGIFGNMNAGSGFIKNLVIEDVIFDNKEATTTSRYAGLITRELAAGAKVENITFKDMEVNLKTSGQGIRYFGLVTATNRGKVENIELRNVNFAIDYDNANSILIGGVVGKLWNTGTVSKVYYESGDFIIKNKEYLTDLSKLTINYLGTIVGEGNGKLAEAISYANIKIEETDLNFEEKVVVLEGTNISIKAETLGAEFKTDKKSFVAKTDEITVKVAPPVDEEIHKLTVNGVDKTADLVDNLLSIPAGDENVLVQVEYKSTETTEKFTLSGTRHEVIVEAGEEVPKSWDFGSEITIKGIKAYGEIAWIKLNEVSYPVENDRVTFTIMKDTKIEVRYTQTKQLRIGGIAGRIGIIENVVFAGSVDLNTRIPFTHYEAYNIGAITSEVYQSYKNVLVINSTITINGDTELRTINPNRFLDIGNKVITDGAIVTSTIAKNGVDYDDGHVSLDAIPEGLITSEYITEKLPK